MNKLTNERKKIKGPQAGLGLPEMMVSLAVFSLLMLLLGAIFIRGDEQLRATDAKISLHESGRQGLDWMSREIREASAAFVTIGGGGTTLTFQIPTSVDSLGKVTWSAPILYQVGGNGTQLIRTDTGTGGTTILANHVQSVNFTGNGNPIQVITFSVTSQKTLVNGRLLSVTATAQARLRN